MTTKTPSWRLERAYVKLMQCLNDPDQEDCLYGPTLTARDAVNKAIKSQGKTAAPPKSRRLARA